LELKGKHQLLVYADVNILGVNIKYLKQKNKLYYRPVVRFV